MNVSARGVFVTAAAVLMLAGCSSNEAKPADTATPAAAPAAPAAREACALITVDEAEKILGSPVTATARSSTSQRSTCDYVSKSFEAFTLEVVWKGGEDEIKSARSAAKNAVNAAGGEQDQVVNDAMGTYRVENLGDEAFFSRRTLAYVRKGEAVLAFQTAGLNDPALQKWIALARAALARL